MSSMPCRPALRVVSGFFAEVESILNSNCLMSTWWISKGSFASTKIKIVNYIQQKKPKTKIIYPKRKIWNIYPDGQLKKNRFHCHFAYSITQLGNRDHLFGC